MRKAHPGEPIPSASPDLPSPVRGGKYGASNNIRNYENLGDKELDPAVQPKGYSFQGDFLGREDLATFDDQMSSALPGKPSQPELYGTVQEMMEHLAAEHSTTPANFQGVTWAGLKGAKGKPMMSHWNDMIERTSRLTGLSPEEVLDRYVHSSGPVYSGGPAATGMGRRRRCPRRAAGSSCRPPRALRQSRPLNTPPPRHQRARHNPQRNHG
jgi:hypothetical protein